MDNIGSNYDPDNLPEIILKGGGGSGAEATPELINGAISDISVLSFGSGYREGTDDEDKD